MAVQALREERQVSLVTSTGRVRFATGAALLDQLAAYRPPAVEKWIGKDST